MPDLVNVTYDQTGRSISTDHMGMREMQVRAFAAKEAQYLLLKAPPASGKSGALMFLGLDKLFNQGLKKVVVAVPERSIGGSFARTDLTNHGFFVIACIELDVFDNDGNRYTPREWFDVPLHIIETAVELLINGEIVNYRYNHARQEIVEK